MCLLIKKLGNYASAAYNTPKLISLQFTVSKILVLLKLKNIAIKPKTIIENLVLRD